MKIGIWDTFMAFCLSHRKTNAMYYHLYVECKKYNRLSNTIQRKHWYREQTSGYHWGEEGKIRGRRLRSAHVLLWIK